MAYDPTNKKLSITGGLSIDEVRRCLTKNSRDLGTLAKANNINIWAKYKPVTSPDDYGPTGKSTDSEWWKGTDGKCGINFTTYNNLGTLSSGFLHELSQGNLTWTMATLLAPYRLTDFDGYWHLAACPIQKCGASKLLVDDSGNLQIDFQSILFPEGTDNLQFTDIVSSGSAMSNWYFSLLIIKQNTSTYFVASANNKLSNGDFSVVFTSMKQNLGTYRIFPFLSSYKIVQGGSAQAGQFCSIGVTEAEVIEVAQATNPYQMIVSGSLDGSRRYIDIDLTLKSNAGAHTFTGVTVQLSRSTNPTNYPGTVLEFWTFSDHTVSAGGAYSYATTRKTYTVPQDNYYYWLSAYSDGVPVERYVALMESPIR